MAEPRNKHDGRCAIWVSDAPCDCRGPDGYTRRQAFEDEWAALSLRERAARYDRYASI